MNPKNLSPSKSTLFYVLAAIAGLLPVLFGAEPSPVPQGLLSTDQAIDAAGAVLPAAQAGLPLLREVLPAEYYAWLSGIVIGGNLLLTAVKQVRAVFKRPQEAE